MTIERWTDDRLDKLANGVERLVEQLQQIGSRVEQTCDRLDAFLEGQHHSPQADDQLSNPLSNQLSHQASPAPVDSSVHLLARLTTLESQMQQITQRVQSLERHELIQISSQVQPIALRSEVIAGETFEDDDIEDEPDEILWDFFDPTEQQK